MTRVVLAVLLALSSVSVCGGELSLTPKVDKGTSDSEKPPGVISVDRRDVEKNCSMLDNVEDQTDTHLALLEKRLAVLEARNKHLQRTTRHLTEKINDLKKKFKDQEILVPALKTELVTERQKRNRLRCFEEKQPETCQDLVKLGCGGGVLELSSDIHTALGRAFCDGPWLVFQTRQTGHLDFYRTWQDYRNGFGDVQGEYWLGLEAVRQLTSQGRWYLRVDLRDKSGHSADATYSNFRLGSEANHYTLKFDGFVSGAAGDSLSFSRGNHFSTKDSDHDRNKKSSCAVQYHGAWWYRNCLLSNLNGHYNDDSYSVGLVWSTWRGYRYSLPFTQMKIKPM